MKSKNSKASPSVAHLIPISGSTRPEVPQARLLRKSDPKNKIRVSVYARPNPTPPGTAPASLAELASKLPGERKYPDQKTFEATYGANPDDLDKIAAWAKSQKLKVVDSSVAKRRVLVEGTVGDISKAFGVQLNEYEHPEFGRFRGRFGQVHVPADLYGVIQGVFGLDTRQVGKPRLRRANKQPAPVDELLSSATTRGRRAGGASASNPFPGCFFPTQLAQLYNYPAGLTGKGEKIAIFAFNGTTPDPRGGYKLASLQTYFERVLGGMTPTIKDVVVQGPGNDPGPDTQASSRRGDATGEVMLDMCVVGSVAPEASIFMYFTEFTSQGWVDALQEAINDDNDISVISISYGNPEDDPDGAWTAMGVQVVNQAFQAAAAKGITICCASGDDGSSDQVPAGAHVDFPASSPFVLGVGGTRVTASDTSITDEVVWNETFQDAGATGGGVSSIFTRPTYQNSAGVPASVNPPHNQGRGVPDVAADADPLTGVIIIHVNGKQLESIGGTSASAPLWAALIARLNQGLDARCGFLNPLLYLNFPHGVLNDIVSGNNGAYSANAGWDACTGLGSPDGTKLLNALSTGAPQKAKSVGH